MVTADTLDDLPAVYDLAKALDVMRWALFFLIPVGRGMLLPQVSPDQAEQLCHWLAELIPKAPFQIKTTEAPHLRRVVIQRMLARGLSMAEIRRLPMARGFGVRDGNGILFVSHTGDVYPSGFLPAVAGNVRNQEITEIYRFSPVFRAIRDVDTIKGKCGRCEFRKICGGSRARAFGATGDFLESDPLCPYQPKSKRLIEASDDVAYERGWHPA